VTLDPARGRYKYFLTRPCLDSGSLVLGRSLEQVFPASGTVTFIASGGEEIQLTINPQDKRVYGLNEFFNKNRLSVNDTLFITPLGERRYSLEGVARVREERIQTAKAAPPPMPPKRVIVEETSYVREVREVHEPRVSPYPKGLIYPNGNKAENETEAKTDGKTDLAGPEMPRGRTPLRQNPDPTPAMRARASLERALNKDHEIKPIIKSESRPEIKAEPTAQPKAAAQPVAVTPATSLERAQAAFVALGYTVDRIEAADPRTGFGGGLMLAANLGARTYRVALAVLEGEKLDLEHPRLRTTFEVAKRGGAKYYAICANNDALGTINPKTLSEFTLACVDEASLEQLLSVTRLAPIGPLDLEGYWNAGAITLETVETLESSATDSLSARGAFSFVTLSLSKQMAPCVLKPDDVMRGLEGSGVTQTTVREVLETLCRAPFMLLLNLGNNEYYLRQDMVTALEGLTDYAGGLRQRLRATEIARAADATLTAVE
jgi:hypothetical protein